MAVPCLQVSAKPHQRAKARHHVIDAPEIERCVPGLVACGFCSSAEVFGKSGSSAAAFAPTSANPLSVRAATYARSESLHTVSNPSQVSSGPLLVSRGVVQLHESMSWLHSEPKSRVRLRSEPTAPVNATMSSLRAHLQGQENYCSNHRGT